jgi:hypothetical protein
MVSCSGQVRNTPGINKPAQSLRPCQKPDRQGGQDSQGNGLEEKIKPANNCAAAKGVSEFLSQLIKQIIIGSSWEIRKVDFNSCSF